MKIFNRDYSNTINIIFNNISNRFKGDEVIPFKDVFKYNYETMKNVNFLELLEDYEEELMYIIENEKCYIGDALRETLSDEYGTSNAFYDILEIDFDTYKNKFIKDFSDLMDGYKYEHYERHEEDFYMYIEILTNIIEEEREEIDEDLKESLDEMTFDEAVEVYELNCGI